MDARPVGLRPANEHALHAEAEPSPARAPRRLRERVLGRRPGRARRAERFRRFSYEELVARDKLSLDITWLRDESLDDADGLPPPDVLAREIVEDLEAALSEFAAIAEALRSREQV